MFWFVSGVSDVFRHISLEKITIGRCGIHSDICWTGHLVRNCVYVQRNVVAFFCGFSYLSAQAQKPSAPPSPLELTVTPAQAPGPLGLGSAVPSAAGPIGVPPSSPAAQVADAAKGTGVRTVLAGL